MFQPQLWPLHGVFRPDRFSSDDERDQDANEVWFVRSHGDVGGGYPEPKSGLAKITLDWMINEAQHTELEFDVNAMDHLVLGKDKDPSVGPTATAAHNPSMTPGWAAVEFLPRFKRRHVRTRRSTLARVYVPLFEERIVPDGAQVHSSVFEHDASSNQIKRTNIPEDVVIV